MVPTYGLTHINLAVRDLGRALRFYEQVFGLREYGRGDGLVHTQGFWQARHHHLRRGLHHRRSQWGRRTFRFSARRPCRHRFVPSPRSNTPDGAYSVAASSLPASPYAYAADPDGYEIEIWFE